MTNDITSAAADYISVQTEGAAYGCTVETARSVLDTTICQILVPEGDHLVLRASSPSDQNTKLQSLPFSDRIFEQAYNSEKPYVIHDTTDVRSATDTATSNAARLPQPEGSDHYRSLMIVPYDPVGLFLAADQQPSQFTDDDAERIEQLLSYAELSLNRIRSQARRNARGERLTEVINTFVHDLRSPLQAAIGHLSLARQTGDDDYFERVTAAHDRMEELLHDMSRLAETGKRVDVLEAIDLQSAVEKAWTTVPTRDATLEMVDTRTVKADESRLCQLMENLLKNAVDHGPSDVHIRVGSLESGFYIEDDGPGIPVDDRETVFQWSTSSDQNHSGLGLSIVKGIVDAHGWEIDITDSTIDGVRFEIITE